MASQKAISVFEKRKTPVAAYYVSWGKWLPVYVCAIASCVIESRRLISPRSGPSVPQHEGVREPSRRLLCHSYAFVPFLGSSQIFSCLISDSSLVFLVSTSAPVQLIYALHASLTHITKSSPSLEERFAMHKAASNKIKDAMEGLGLGLIPLSRHASANGM